MKKTEVGGGEVIMCPGFSWYLSQLDRQLKGCVPRENTPCTFICGTVGR